MIQNRRRNPRLMRQTQQAWQLRVDDDALITKNISNISPSGLAFKAPMSSRFHVGQRVRLHLSLDKDQGFECEGEIIWAKTTQEIPGSMRMFGVHFTKIPSSADAYIMKKINDLVLQPRRLELVKREFSPPSKSRKSRFKLSRLFAALFFTTLAAVAFVFLYFYQKEHPEEMLSHKITQAFDKRAATMKN